MRINGNQANSGTFVIGPGQVATLDLPIGAITFAFNPTAQPSGMQFNAQTSTLSLNGMDNPLGTASGISLQPAVGRAVTIGLAVYAIGEGANITRVIHYTAS